MINYRPSNSHTYESEYVDLGFSLPMGKLELQLQYLGGCMAIYLPSLLNL